MMPCIIRLQIDAADRLIDCEEILMVHKQWRKP
jgi:hypothetical protein